MVCKRLLLVVVLLIPLLSSATHLKGGYIRIEHIPETSLRYRITLHIYAMPGGVMVGGAATSLDFGDGQSIAIPEQAGTPIDENASVVVYTVEHTYAAFGNYIVSYSEPNRNQGLINLAGSVNTPFYIESMVVADATYPGFASPELLTTPILSAPLYSEFTYGISAIDRKGYTLIYQVSTPGTSTGSLASAYSLPEHFNVNPFNGLVSWDTMFKNGYLTGQYLFNIRVYQFKDDLLMGYMTLEFTVILQDDPEQLRMAHNQSLDNKNRIFIEAGKEKTIRVFFESNQSSALRLKTYTDLDPLNITFTAYDSVSGGAFIRAGTLAIRNEAVMVRDSPFVLTVRGTSDTNRDFEKDVTFMIFSKDTDITEIPAIPDFDDEDDTAFELYPNPFVNALYIDWPSHAEFDLTLFNLAGQTVYETRASSGAYIQFDFLSQGLYLYKITDGKVSEKGKVVKR